MVDQEALNTVLEAVSFASQALGHLPAKLQQVLDYQNDNARSWQRQGSQVIQACEERLETLSLLVTDEMQQALENVKYRDDLLAQVQEEMRSSISRIQSYKQLEDELRLEIHKKEEEGKALEKELAFQQVDKTRLSDTLDAREKETRELRMRLDEVEERCKFLEEQHSRSKKARVVEVHKIRTSWESEVKEKDEEIGQLYDQCSEVNKDLSEMNGKMREMAAVTKAMKAKLVAAQEENGKALEDQKTTQALAESQKQTIAKLEKEVAALQTQVDSKAAAEAELQESVKMLQEQKREADLEASDLASGKEEIQGDLDDQMRTVVQQQLEIKKLREELQDMKEEKAYQESLAKSEREKRRKESEERRRRAREKPGSAIVQSTPTFSVDSMLKGEITNEMSRQRAASLEIKAAPERMEQKVQKTENDLKHFYHFMEEDRGVGLSNDEAPQGQPPEGNRRKPPQQPPPPPRILVQQHQGSSSIPPTPSAPGSAPNTLQKRWNSISKSQRFDGDDDISDSSMDDSDRESETVARGADEVISTSKDVYQKLKELKAQRQQSLNRAQKSLRRLSVKPSGSPMASPSK